MQIIFWMSERFMKVLLLLFGLPIAAADFELRQPVDVDTMLILSNRGTRLKASWNTNGYIRPVAIEAQLQERLRKADEVQLISSAAFVLAGQPAFVAVVRLPSNPGSPQGFCGAGHEDSLLLISIKNKHLRLQDQYLLQSCLQSISLISDQGDEPRDALIPMTFPWIARVEIITASQVGSVTRCIRVHAQKLMNADCPESAGVRP